MSISDIFLYYYFLFYMARIKLNLRTSTIVDFAFFEGELKYLTSTVRTLPSLWEGMAFRTRQYL